MRTFLALVLMSLATLGTAQNIFTVAGIPVSHRNDVDGQPALQAPLASVYALLIDKVTGRLIFHDQSLVVRLEPDGSLLTIAGGGANTPRPFQVPGTGPTDTTLASALSVQVLRGMTQDAAGALYVSDAVLGRVFRIGADGIVTTVAGGGLARPGVQSDGGPATDALLQSPRGLVFDSQGNLDIAEVYCNCIRQVSPVGVVSTLYIAPLSVPFGFPNLEALAIDAQDNLYFTEWMGNVVMKVSRSGSATTIAGSGAHGFSGDGGPATAAQLAGPSGVTLDAKGNIYIADTGNNRIRRVAVDGTIATIAGTGACGFSGDGGPAVAAQLCQPAEIVFDNAGNLIVADFLNRRVRAITPNGIISTIAGSGVMDPALTFRGSNGVGNNGPEIHAVFDLLGGIAFDAAGNLYATEAFGNVIRKVAADGTVSTFAGTGQRGSSGDEGPAIQAQLFNPGPLSVGPDGAVYVITGDSRVRKITPDGIIHLVAGTGTGTGLNRAQGDGGPAVMATLNEPGGVAFDQQGNIFIADTSNARVRKIDKNGIITTVAGPGHQGVDYFNGVAVDAQGNLYVSRTHAAPPSVSGTVNRVNPDGSLTPVAGTGEPCVGGAGQFTNDGSPALQARLCAVTSMSTDRNGVLYLSEGNYSLVLRLAGDGTIQRVAGNTAALGVGDGGPALQASLIGGQGFSPEAVAFDPSGNMYLGEPGLNIVREVTATPYVLKASPDHISAAGSAALTQTIAVSTNFAEQFPYIVRVSTEDGGSWLSVNRVTGVTGEAIQVSINPMALARGIYHGTVAIIVPLPGSVNPPEVDVPVSLTVP